MDKKVVLEQGTIVYQELGTGLPLIFLHGTLSNANTWRHVIQPLSRHFRCIVPTLPLGAHTIPIHATRPITSDYITEMLRQFADALHLEQFALLGNDTGGAYAQIFTAAYPDRVSHLMLSNCDAFEVFPPKLFALLPFTVRLPGFINLMALAMRSPALAKSKLILGALTKTLDGKTMQALYLNRFIEDARIRQDCKQLVLGWNKQDTLNAVHALKKFQKPVLVLWGLEDTDLFPLSLGERVANIFTDVHFQPIEGSSTYIQEDRPDALIHHVQTFLQQTGAFTMPLMA